MSVGAWIDRDNWNTDWLTPDDSPNIDRDDIARVSVPSIQAGPHTGEAGCDGTGAPHPLPVQHRTQHQPGGGAPVPLLQSQGVIVQISQRQLNVLSHLAWKVSFESISSSLWNISMFGKARAINLLVIKKCQVELEIW